MLTDTIKNELCKLYSRYTHVLTILCIEVEQNLSESVDHWKICDSLFPSTIAKSQLSVAENIKYRLVSLKIPWYLYCTTTLYRRCILYNDPELVRIFNQLTRPGCIPHSLHGANFLHAACRLFIIILLYACMYSLFTCRI